MKFLFFTDTHIRGTNPQNRKDNFIETLHHKMREVLSIATHNKVDVILHGGDIFDRPDISPSLVRDLIILLKDFSFPIYAVAGNHDVYGQNPHTLHRTMLGLLDGIGIIKIIKPKEKIYFSDGTKKIQLTGQSYFYGIDTPEYLDSYIVEKDPDVDFAIHMVHGMLLDKPFFEGMAYTLINNIVSTEADITLSGHYHTGFDIKCIDDKYFINPGSLVRINNSLGEFSRRPKVVIIDIEDNIKITELPLKSCQPGEDVLDRSKIEATSFREKKLSAFVQSVYSTGHYDTIDINNLIEEISRQENLSENVIKEALKRIGYAQELFSGDDHLEVS